MTTRLTDKQAEKAALAEVRKLYGDDIAPLTEPRIATKETVAASVRRRAASLFRERPDLLDYFERHMERKRPFQHWWRSYIVAPSSDQGAFLVMAQVDLTTGEVEVSLMSSRDI